MRITCRIRADDGFTDVCECPEFTSVTTGLGIAWVCGQLRKYPINACTVSVKHEREGRVEMLPVAVTGTQHAAFIRAVALHNPDTVTLSGDYENNEIAITVVLQKKVIQIFYPRSLEGQMMPFEQMIYSAIKEHFSILKPIETINAGSKRISVYSCPLFVNNKVGLNITALCGYCPDSSLRWYALYREGVPRENPHYGDLTSRKRLPPREFVRLYNGERLSRSVTMLFWKGKHLSVTCDYQKRKIYVCWDKWLNRDYPEFVRWLLPAVYEQLFGQT